MSAQPEAIARHLALQAEIAQAGADQPAALRALREEGRALFAAQGFPHAKQEEWRYSNPARWLEPERGLPDSRAPLTSLPSLLPAETEAECAVVRGGLLLEETERIKSLASAARAGELGALGRIADPKQHPFAALGLACLRDGVVLDLAGASSRAIHLLHAAEGDHFVPARVFVRARASSQALVVVEHVSLDAGAHFTNAVLELDLEPNAQLDLVVIQREGPQAAHVSNLQARLARDANLRVHTVCIGSGYLRNDLGVVLAGEGARCELRGLFAAGADQLVDNHTNVDHAVPHCDSDELYKGILAGRSRGVFRGRVLVRPDAQKTDARQSNPNLLLGDGCEIDTKPQLEIHADDVRCSHGSTVGRLDEDALFYLRARGIDADAARRVLTLGFGREILDALPIPGLGDALGEPVARVLEGGQP